MKPILSALGIASVIIGIALGYDHLATDKEVEAGLKSQKRLTDHQYLSQRLEFIRWQRDQSCKRNPDGEDCAMWERILHEAEKEYREFIRRQGS